jgi:hypothetical protein
MELMRRLRIDPKDLYEEIGRALENDGDVIDAALFALGFRMRDEDVRSALAIEPRFVEWLERLLPRVHGNAFEPRVKKVLSML